MIVCIPAPAAETLSQALWGLTRPAAIRAEDDTQFLFPWALDNAGNRWIHIDTTFSIPVHAEAVLDGIADILQPHIDAGNIPADTNTQLAAFIESKRGSSIVVYDAFPDYFKSLAKTFQQMVAEGLFNTPFAA